MGIGVQPCCCGRGAVYLGSWDNPNSPPDSLYKFTEAGGLVWAVDGGSRDGLSRVRSMVVNQNGEVFTIARADDWPDPLWQLRKFSPAGAFEWSVIPGLSTGLQEHPIAADADGNVYVVIADDENEFGSDLIEIRKYSGAGTEQLAFRPDVQLDVFGDEYWAGVQCLDVHADGSIYFSGQHPLTDDNLWKYDSGGTLVWSMGWALAVGPKKHIAVLKSGGCVLSFEDDIRKIGADGTEVTTGNWPITGTGTTDCTDIVVDADDNVYTATGGEVTKRDAAGDVVWERTDIAPDFLCVDEIGSVYLANEIDTAYRRLRTDGSDFYAKEVETSPGVLHDIDCLPGRAGAFR